MDSYKISIKYNSEFRVFVSSIKPNSYVYQNNNLNDSIYNFGLALAYGKFMNPIAFATRSLLHVRA